MTDKSVKNNEKMSGDDNGLENTDNVVPRVSTTNNDNSNLENNVSNSSSEGNELFMSRNNKNVFVDPTIPNMGSICIYCMIDDGFTFSGKFLNCLNHGGLSNKDSTPCFHCIVQSNGTIGRFKLCNEHLIGANTEYRVIGLRTMTKVLKVEDNSENEELIENSKISPKINGYSLGSNRKITVVKYKKAIEPDFSHFRPKVYLKPLDQLLIDEIRNNENTLTNVTERINISNEYVNVNDNVSNINADITDLDFNNNDENIEIKQEKVDDNDHGATISDDTRSNIFQTQNEGIVLTSTQEPLQDRSKFQIPPKEPNARQVQHALGNKAMSLDDYKRNNDVIENILDNGLVDFDHDKVAKGWYGTMCYLFRKNNVMTTDQAMAIAKQVVTMMKLHLNLYLHGCEFLVKYQNAQEKEEKAERAKEKGRLIAHAESSISTVLKNKLDETNEKNIEKLAPILVKAVKDELERLERLRQANAASVTETPESVNDHNMEETDGGSNVIKINPRSDDLFEIPFKDGFKTFNREQLNQMVDSFIKKDASTPDVNDGAGPSRMVEDDLDITPRTYKEHRDRKNSFNRGRGRGNYNNRGHPSNKRPGGAQERMDTKRRKHVEEASSFRPTVGQIIALGEQLDATVAQQKKAKLANELVNDRVSAILDTKSRKTKNPNGQGWIVITDFGSVPENQQYVWHQGHDGRGDEWMTLPNFKLMLKNKLMKKIFDDM